MQIDLKGRRAVVTGGSRGIGYATVLALADAGASVSTCARHLAPLEQVRQELAGTGATVHVATCDLAEASSIEGYVAEAAEALGGIDILVNNVTGQSSGNSEADWRRVFEIDLMGTVRTTGAAVPYLRSSGCSSVINIASRTAFRASPDSQAYGAVKAALMQLTTSQALQLAPGGIRVNCVAPGSTESPGGWWEKAKVEHPDLYERTRASFPFGRFGRPEDVAGVIVFLASPLGRWITGQTILADGGQTLGR